jgi:hypothetical protein
MRSTGALAQPAVGVVAAAAGAAVGSVFHYYTAGFGLLQESPTAACTWRSCWG